MSNNLLYFGEFPLKEKKSFQSKVDKILKIEIKIFFFICYFFLTISNQSPKTPFEIIASFFAHF